MHAAMIPIFSPSLRSKDKHCLSTTILPGRSTAYIAHVSVGTRSPDELGQKAMSRDFFLGLSSQGRLVE